MCVRLKPESLTYVMCVTFVMAVHPAEHYFLLKSAVRVLTLLTFDGVYFFDLFTRLRADYEVSYIDNAAARFLYSVVNLQGRFPLGGPLFYLTRVYTRNQYESSTLL